MIFRLNDKLYQASDEDDTLRFLIQLGRKDRSGKIRYVRHRSGTTINNVIGWYNGINIGYGYIKRLSYRASKLQRYHELAKHTS